MPPWFEACSGGYGAAPVLSQFLTFITEQQPRLQAEKSVDSTGWSSGAALGGVAAAE